MTLKQGISKGHTQSWPCTNQEWLGKKLGIGWAGVVQFQGCIAIDVQEEPWAVCVADESIAVYKLTTCRDDHVYPLICLYVLFILP